MNLQNILTLLLASTSLVTFGQTNVPPIISSSQTWNTGGSPYIIGQNTLIENGAKVTVDPGVVIQSSAKDLSITVDGEFQAIGTQANPVTIDSLEIYFSDKSVDYDPTSGNGAYFNWCIFNGDVTSFSKNAIKCLRTTLKVENCTFNHNYTSLMISNQSNDSLSATIDHCTFNGHADGRYAINSFGATNKTIVTNSTFQGSQQLYFYGKLHFEGNLVEGHSKFEHYAYYEGLIKCNQFKNSSAGVNLIFYSSSNVKSHQVVNNTFDSLGSGSLLEIKRQTGQSDLSFLEVNHNNFLHATGSTKLAIVGINSSPGTSDRINCENNYWGTTDSLTIEGFIDHYSDNINVFGKADFQPISGSPISGCDTSSCTASYYLALDTTTPFQLFVIDNSSGVTSNTSYSWTFGDGTSSTTKNPTHKYNSFGKYELCLTISDNAAGCQSTFCDSLGMDSHGNLLKADGFIINILSEGHVGVSPAKLDKAIKLYPNPTNGKVTLQGFDANSVVNYALINSTGQAVLQTASELTTENGSLKLDLSDHTPGLYILSVHTRDSSRVFKLSIED